MRQESNATSTIFSAYFAGSMTGPPPAQRTEKKIKIDRCNHLAISEIGFPCLTMEMSGRKLEGAQQRVSKSDGRKSGGDGEAEGLSFSYLDGSQGEPGQLFPFGCVQRYCSSAPEPVSVFSYLAAPKIAGRRRDIYAPAFSRYVSNASVKLAFTSNGGLYSTLEVTRHRSIFAEISSARRFSLVSSARMTLRS